MKKLILTLGAAALTASTASALSFSIFFTFNPIVNTTGSFFGAGSTVELGVGTGSGFTSLDSIEGGDRFSTATEDFGDGNTSAFSLDVGLVDTTDAGLNVAGQDLSIKVVDITTGEDIIFSSPIWNLPSDGADPLSTVFVFAFDTDLNTATGGGDGPFVLEDNASITNMAGEDLSEFFGIAEFDGIQGFANDVSAFATGVPEPSTYAAIFGGLALALAVVRRRIRG